MWTHPQGGPPGPLVASSCDKCSLKLIVGALPPSQLYHYPHSTPHNSGAKPRYSVSGSLSTTPFASLKCELPVSLLPPGKVARAAGVCRACRGKERWRARQEREDTSITAACIPGEAASMCFSLSHSLFLSRVFNP